MTSISGSVYIDNLNDTYNEYNNANHTTIKMKPIDLNLSPLIDFNVEVNDKNPKFEVGDHVKKSKRKKILRKFFNPSWSKKVFFDKNVKNTVP